MPVTVTVKKNGLYRVEATDGVEIKMVNAEGKAFDLQGKTAFSLPRCGHSANSVTPLLGSGRFCQLTV